MIYVKMTRHKTVAAVIGALVTALSAVGAAISDGTLTGEELGILASVVVTQVVAVFAVYQTRNRPADVPTTLHRGLT